MARKDLLNNQKFPDEIPLEPLEPISPVKAKISGAMNRSFEMLKFILGVGLLPFVYSFTVSFLNASAVIGGPAGHYFWTGVATFIVVYLFVWEPSIVYYKGQKVLEIVFTLFRPLVKVAPFVLPVYSIMVFAAYWIVSFFVSGTLKYFLFLFGFFLVLHLTFGAKTLRSRKGGFLKGHYIFSFSFVYILNIVIAAFCLNAIFEHYSFVGFFNNSFLIARDIFRAIFHQLFVIQR